MRLARVLIALAFPLFFSGCLYAMYGSPPRQARLEQLKQGQSTPTDVLLLLGEPRGDGVVRWAPSLGPRKVWYYEYVVGGFRRIETKILLVFFDQDRYDGYLWFSSASLVDKE